METLLRVSVSEELPKYVINYWLLSEEPLEKKINSSISFLTSLLLCDTDHGRQLFTIQCHEASPPPTWLSRRSHLAVPALAHLAAVTLVASGPSLTRRP